MQTKQNENPDDSAHRKTVRQIQKYLSSVALADPSLPQVKPDGVYGKKTAEAVACFQKSRSLPVTGKVDFATWQALVKGCREATRALSAPTAISPFLCPLKNGELCVGDRSDLVLLVRVMLHCLGVEYDCLAVLPISDSFDDDMEGALREYQRIQGIEQTGSVNRQTWDRLADSYNKYIRYAQ